MIPAMILAAGRSSRMGRPKALLTMSPGGITIVRHLVEVLHAGGVADVLVVGRSGDEPLREEVERAGPFARFVENPHADSGQASSLIAGLNAADRPGTRGVLVTLVDLPLITAETVAALMAAFVSASPPIARATHGGRHGHPVIFGRRVFDELRRVNPAVGAKPVLRAHEGAILEVDVPDPGVLQDIDTPEDYQALLSRRL